MVLDSWKRLYSNTPGAKFREVAVHGLWQGADVPNSPTQEARGWNGCMRCAVPHAVPGHQRVLARSPAALHALDGFGLLAGRSSSGALPDHAAGQ